MVVVAMDMTRDPPSSRPFGKRFLLLGAAIAAGILGAPGAAFADPAAPAPVEPGPAGDPQGRPYGSLATQAPLGKGRFGMLLGGGVAVLLPFFEFQVGYGVAPRVDLVARFETVVGLFHYPSLGVRWSPLDLGRWKLGLDTGVNYSFFGIATDQVNFTSTFYLNAQLGISGPVTRNTDLAFAVDNEIDLFDYQSLDGKGSVRGDVHYDATVLRVGMKTRLTEDLDGFLRARLRIPVETLRYEAMSFYVIPSLEIGGVFSF
jgi:hypothetical protein